MFLAQPSITCEGLGCLQGRYLMAAQISGSGQVAPHILFNRMAALRRSSVDLERSRSPTSQSKSA